MSDDQRNLSALSLPRRVVVGANGAYWRYIEPDGVGILEPMYSMCPTSSDNDPVEVVAVFERVPEGEDLLGLLSDLRSAVKEIADESTSSPVSAARHAWGYEMLQRIDRWLV